MPIDFSPDPKLLLVHNRAGITLPFSTGYLANSLLVTGIETPLAYDIAAEVAARLQTAQLSESVSSDLTELAAVALAAHAGGAAADRYRAWGEVKRSGRPIVLCLSGAPGVGKSTLATRLALRLGVHRVIPTDAIREVLRTMIPEAVLPELQLSAHETVVPGDDEAASMAPFVRQARAVSGAVASIAERMAREGRSVMVEGAHLLPGDVRERLAARGCDAIVVERLLTLDDEKVHRAYMLRRTRSDPARPGVRHLQSFAAVRQLQDALRVLARDANVASHDLASADGLTESIVDRIVAVSQESEPSPAI